MKVLFFLGFPNPFPGAGWTRVGFFADQWSRKGHIIEVLGAFSYKAFSKRGVKRLNNINIFNLTFNMGLTQPLVFILDTLISFAVSILVLLSRKPNLAIVSVPAGDVGLGVIIACKITRTKCIVDYRDEWEDYAVSISDSEAAKLFYSTVKKLTAVLYAGCRIIVAVTPNSEKALIKRGLRNVTLITNGADVKAFKPLNIKKDSNIFTIFYSGGIGGYYRLDIVVKAVKKLVDKGLNDIRLLIAGEGEVSKILSLARELDISSHIEYLGSINDKKELAKLIATSDVGILPYDDNPLWKNSVPAKFYEYCACGIPVIATVHNDSYLEELIKKHEIGVTSPPLDEKKLANAIYWLYKNKSFREAAGKRARQLIEEKFDRNKIAEEYLNLIEATL
jgi:glycosyltransferase involved in cell wall biosynthesis